MNVSGGALMSATSVTRRVSLSDHKFGSDETAAPSPWLPPLASLSPPYRREEEVAGRSGKTDDQVFH